MRDPRKSRTDFLAGFGTGCLAFAGLSLDPFFSRDALIEISLALGIVAFVYWARYFFTEPAE